MKNKKKIMFHALAIAVLVLAGVANFALADDLPTGRPILLVEVYDIIVTISKFLIVVGAVLAVIFIIVAGIKYMYAGSDATQVKEAQTMLRNGIIGAAIVFGVGVILKTIDALVSREFFWAQ